MHVMIQIGDSCMMCDEFLQMGIRLPTSIGGTSTTIHLYVNDADKIFNQASIQGQNQLYY